MRAPVHRLAFVLLLATASARAAESYSVETLPIRDEKAVFATVESRKIVAARIRTPGTVVSLSVREGDLVTRGQIIAVVSDKRLRDQIDALDAQIAGLKAQQTQAHAEMARNLPLLENGVISQSTMEGLSTAAALASASVKARDAERRALAEQIAQGNVLAPDRGRVLTIPMAIGAVVMGGEIVATIGTREPVVRLLLPESNAKDIRLGDQVRIEGAGVPAEGSISQIYPQIEDGRLAADLKIPGSDGYFVGQRVRAWVRSEARDAIAIPVNFISTRYGIDYVRISVKTGAAIDVPVQRGHTAKLPNGADGIEILSGLKSGDVLVHP